MKNENTRTVTNRLDFCLDQDSAVLCREHISITEFVTQCCVCRKVKIDDAWVENDATEHAAANYSHGYCPACFSQVLRHIEEAATGAEYN